MIQPDAHDRSRFHESFEVPNGRRLLWVCGVGLAAQLGCSQRDPEEPAGSPVAAPDSAAPSDGGTPNVPPVILENIEEYFPLVDGATWTFRHTHRTDGQWNETATMTRVTFEDEPAWLMEDSPNLDDEVSRQTWKERDGKVLRVYREQLQNGFLSLRVTYDPGFVRFDQTWDRVGAGDVNSYVREETSPDGTVFSETREQQNTVVSVDDVVEVPAGTFENCLQIERFREETGDVSHFWFARGVGKIKEEDQETLTLEELLEYEIP